MEMAAKSSGRGGLNRLLLYDVSCWIVPGTTFNPPEGDDIWQPWLVNAVYGTDFPVESPTDPGKNMGWTDWTHSDHRFQFSQSVTE